MAEHSMKVVRMDDIEWWVGESLEACVSAGKAMCGADCYDEPEEQWELSAEDLQRLKFHDNEESPPVVRTFAEQLAIEVANGGDFPRPFAATDY